MPCEYNVWYVLPGLRKEIVKEMKKKGLKNKEIANILGLTPSAVSQYLKNKRGKLKGVRKLEQEIKKGAERIIEDPRKARAVLCGLCSKAGRRLK